MHNLCNHRAKLCPAHGTPEIGRTRSVMPGIFTITPYARRHRRDTLSLLAHNHRVHSHLDWHETDQWLNSDGVHLRLGWQDERLVGLLGASRPVGMTSWMRLVAAQNGLDFAPLFNILWDDVSRVLKLQDVQTVLVLIIDDWIARYLSALGFHSVETVITLRRDGGRLPVPTSGPVALRVATRDDLEQIAQVDAAAFASAWQISLPDIRSAERIAYSVTVAHIDSTLVGYQLTTLYRASAHLARLAVIPEAQGQGVGSVLLDDLIRRFSRRGIQTMTVNTQASNLQSQRLYRRFGFQRTGYDLPVWAIDL